MNRMYVSVMAIFAVMLSSSVWGMQDTHPDARTPLVAMMGQVKEQVRRVDQLERAVYGSENPHYNKIDTGVLTLAADNLCHGITLPTIADRIKHEKRAAFFGLAKGFFGTAVSFAIYFWMRHLLRKHRAAVRSRAVQASGPKNIDPMSLMLMQMMGGSPGVDSEQLKGMMGGGASEGTSDGTAPKVAFQQLQEEIARLAVGAKSSVSKKQASGDTKQQTGARGLLKKWQLTLVKTVSWISWVFAFSYVGNLIWNASRVARLRGLKNNGATSMSRTPWFSSKKRLDVNALPGEFSPLSNPIVAKRGTIVSAFSDEHLKKMSQMFLAQKQLPSDAGLTSKIMNGCAKACDVIGLNGYAQGLGGALIKSSCRDVYRKAADARAKQMAASEVINMHNVD